MGLVKKASKLLEGVRRHQNDSRIPPQAREGDVSIHSKGRIGQFIEARKLRRRKATVEAREEPSIGDKGQATMAQGTNLTHETSTRQAEYFHKPRSMADPPCIQIAEDEDGEEDEEDDEEDDDEPVIDDESESEDEVDESVVEDMRKLEESFKGISQKYRLINRIGEGTFSTVYKAEQLPYPDKDYEDTLHHHYDQENHHENNPPTKRRRLSSSPQPTIPPAPIQRRKPQYVALKKIYVTSSPHRIQNELEILHALRSSPHICPLLTAFRHLDQVVAVLPYFRHLDFRLYYREFVISDMRHYFHSLLSALHSVHRAGIIHRDIKPTNFLYDHHKQRGVLVDFGLAEKQGTDWQPCLCLENRDGWKNRYLSSIAFLAQQATAPGLSAGYPKNDTRPSRRANRAGTRGFRAPEVLLKCTSQTTKIDIWSTGVILLTLLARRFPFFNSTDDVDAMIEMASLFGKKRMKLIAAMHGSVFESNIETIGERGFTLERIVVWASCREKEQGPISKAEGQAIEFLEGLLQLDPQKRLSAKEALNHDFFVNPQVDEEVGEGQEQEQQGNDMQR